MTDSRLRIYLNRDGSYDAIRGNQLLHYNWSFNTYKIYGVKLITIGPSYVPTGKLVRKPHIQMILQVQRSFGSNESIMNFNEFVNESIRDKMTPKSKKEIMDSLESNPNIEFHRIKRGAGGTFLVGEIDMNYYDIVKLFGEPDEDEWIGNNFYWAVKSSDGRIITIYDNESGLEPEELMEVNYPWHIGGTGNRDFKDLSYYIYNNTLE
jgi:hypothetical protein